jgi:TonB family protein
MLLFAVAVVAGAEEDAGASGGVFGPPLLVSWAPLAYPKEAASQQLAGDVQVRFVVDESGAVAKARAVCSSDTRFENAAVQSVLQWRFKPALESSRPIAFCLDAVVHFRLADLKRQARSTSLSPDFCEPLVPAPHRDAVKEAGDDPVYPDSLLPRHLTGETRAELTIGCDGRVQQVKILATSHSDFVRPALKAVEGWTFQPAAQGDLTVPGLVGASLEFTYVDPGVEPVGFLPANDITIAKTEDGKALDHPPSVLIMVDPVYPYDLAVAGTEGEATADFTIGADGLVRSITGVNATQPEFGRALAAALEGWEFKPAIKGGAKVPVLASKRHRFRLRGKDANSQLLTRLTEQIRRRDSDDLLARGFDGRPVPRFQAAPTYPEELSKAGVAGKAEIQFILDRDGRCRLARIVSASDERFGWAAATAVERWVFDPPKRKSQPVDVRFSIPFEFKPPE